MADSGLSSGAALSSRKAANKRSRQKAQTTAADTLSAARSSGAAQAVEAQPSTGVPAADSVVKRPAAKAGCSRLLVCPISKVFLVLQ